MIVSDAAAEMDVVNGVDGVAATVAVACAVVVIDLAADAVDDDDTGGVTSRLNRLTKTWAGGTAIGMW